MLYRGIKAGIVALGLFALTAGQTLAFDCYVANKPAGAGAVDLTDIKEAGRSGKTVAPGAFISGAAIGTGVDIFIRGNEHPADAPVGIGTLPSQPHCKGSATNGVQTIEPEKCG